MDSLEMDFKSKMELNSKIDFGLEKGIYSNWKQQLLVDFTIEVEEHEFKVHKLVLASVSDYFQAMIFGSMKESETDRVQLKGISADAISKLLDLIYSQEYDIIIEHTAEILECAMYFQMPGVIKECRKIIMDKLGVDNCGQFLAVCQLYSFDEEVQRVKSFIESNHHEVVENCKHDEMPFEGIQLVIDHGWELRKPEWEMFRFIKHWVQADYENRKVHLNDLMSQVRFCLLQNDNLAAIKQMEIFGEGSWCQLVEMAEEYHKLPSHYKVLNSSQQTQLRGEAAPVYIAKAYWGLGSWLYYERGSWIKHPIKTILEYREVKPIVLEVNNFLFTCTGLDKEQVWHIFNPRDMSWTRMTGMLTPKTDFALVHLDNKLYALGGHIGSHNEIQSISDGIEEYDLKTGIWSSTKKMSMAVTKHGACVYDNCIYVSGGMRGSTGGHLCSAELECLNITTGCWEKKADMYQEMHNHKMHVMVLHGLKVIIIIDQYFNITYYNPTTDEWSTFWPDFSAGHRFEYEWCCESVLLAKGNTVFLLNILKNDVYQYIKLPGDDEPADSGYVLPQCISDCVHHEGYDHVRWSDTSVDPTQEDGQINLVWTFSENEYSVSEKRGQKCPLPVSTYEKDFFSVLLLVP